MNIPCVGNERYNEKWRYFIFFNTLRNIYGVRFSFIFRELRRNIKNIAMLEKQIYMFLFFKRYKLIPPSIKLRNKLINEDHRYRKIISKTELHILKKILNQKQNNLKKLKITYFNNIRIIFTLLKEKERIETMTHLNSFKMFNQRNHFVVIDRKIKFYCKKYNLVKCVTKNNGFVNLSKMTFTDDQLKILNEGPKYECFSGKRTMYKEIDILADLEILNRKITNTKEIVSADVTPFKSKYQKKVLEGFNSEVINIYKNAHIPSDYNTKENSQAVIKSIKTMNDVVFTKGDKTTVLVAMDKDDYINKMQNTLIENNYVENIKDNIHVKEKKLHETLNCLKEGNYIDQNVYLFLNPVDSRHARAYGNVKLHKENRAMRPIVNTRGTYLYNTAKWLCTFLNRYINCKYTVKNSFELIDRLKEVVIKPNSYIVSLDIVSLYSSIPVEKTIDILLHKYRFDSDKLKKIPISHLNDLLHLCISEVTCEFDDRLFTQQKGCGMGNPLSALLSEIYLNIIERKIVEFKGIKISMFVRFVDDILIVLDEQEHLDILLNYITNLDNDIKFTWEVEKNKHISYLDVNIHRMECLLEFGVHHKSSNNDIKINWLGLSPNHIKINILNNEIIRAYRICSTEKFLNMELLYIKETYLKNNYPCQLIDDRINYYNILHTNKYKLDDNVLNNYRIKNNTDKNIYAVMPFCVDFNKIKIEFDTFKKEFLQIFPNLENINLVMRSEKKLSDILCKRDLGNNDHMMSKNVIYEIQCECDRRYVGVTSRFLRVRYRQHTRYQHESQVFQHIKSENHMVHESNCIILKREDNIFKMYVYESLFIRYLQPVLNISEGMELMIENIF